MKYAVHKQAERAKILAHAWGDALSFSGCFLIISVRLIRTVCSMYACLCILRIELNEIAAATKDSCVFVASVTAKNAILN